MRTVCLAAALVALIPMIRLSFGTYPSCEVGDALALPTHRHDSRATFEREADIALYSSGMIGRIGAKGQVVIPKALRDRAHLQPGDEVDFEMRDEEIVLVARRSPVRLGGRFSRTGMAARLLDDRTREPR